MQNANTVYSRVSKGREKYLAAKERYLNILKKSFPEGSEWMVETRRGLHRVRILFVRTDGVRVANVQTGGQWWFYPNMHTYWKP